MRFPKLSRPIWWIIGILWFGIGLGVPLCLIGRWGAAAMRQYDLDERLWGAAGEGRTALVQHLLDEGANIDYVDAGHSVLQLAVSSGEPKMVRMLLDRGAKTCDPLGTTEMLAAVRGGNEPIARMFLDRGAAVNCRDYDGETPLTLAVKSEDPVAVVKLLLDHGAHVNAANKEGDTPLIAAVRCGMPENRHNVAACSLLLDRGANIDARNLDGHSPLMCALYGHHDDAARLLLKRGADVNLGWKEDATTALGCAEIHSPEFVPLLKRLGARERREPQ